MVREYRDYQVNCLREPGRIEHVQIIIEADNGTLIPCLLYTSDAADE